MTPDLRESLGRRVRAIWVEWAQEQPNPKSSWLLPWEDLAEPDREVDRRIGEELYRLGQLAGPYPPPFIPQSHYIATPSRPPHQLYGTQPTST